MAFVKILTKSLVLQEGNDDDDQLEGNAVSDAS